MSFRSQLVIDRDTREVCLQIRMGRYEAVKPLPDGFGNWSMQAQKAFIEANVDEMIQGLLEMKRNDERKLRKKADT